MKSLFIIEMMVYAQYECILNESKSQNIQFMHLKNSPLLVTVIEDIAVLFA